MKEASVKKEAARASGSLAAILHDGRGLLVSDESVVLEQARSVLVSLMRRL